MILVTGSTGFVGRRVVAELRARGHAVRCLVHTPARSEVIQGDGVEISYGDVLDPSSLVPALEGVSDVVHLVAVIREKGSLTFRRVNHLGTRNVVEAARAAGVERLVYLSGIGASDNPRLRFLYFKGQAEQEVAQGGMAYTILRPSLLFGEGDEFFNTLAGLVKAMPAVPIAGDGQALFQPMAVDELARCVALCFEQEELANQVVELGGPEHLTYDRLIDLVAETLGVRRVKMHVPLPLMRRIVQLMELTLPRPPATTQQLDLLSIENTTGLDNVERWFGFRPRPVRGNIDYIQRLSYRDALGTAFGFIPRHIRDH